MRQRQAIAFGLLVLAGTALCPTPASADTISAAQFAKLEERVRDLESRMAKAEAESHKQMEMMMKHPHGTTGMDKSQDMRQPSPMGQAPQQNPGMGAAPQSGSMPSGGMGHM